MTTIPSTDHQWRERLLDSQASAQAKVKEAYIELGRDVCAYKQFCTKTQGGTNFTARVGEWLGIDAAAVSRLASIGERADELLFIKQELPESQLSLGLIAAQPDPVFKTISKRLEPAMSQAEIRDLIREVKGIPATVPKALEERPVATIVEATKSDERLQAALELKDKEIEALRAERDEAIAEASALRKQLEAMKEELTDTRFDLLRSCRDALVADGVPIPDVVKDFTHKLRTEKSLPKEGTFSARDLLGAA